MARISDDEAQRNLEMGAVFIKLRRNNPPLGYGHEGPAGTVHTKAIEIGLRLGPSKSHRLYKEMMDDGRFNNPTPGRDGKAAYEFTESGEKWANRLLDQHRAGRKPWLLSWREPA